VWTVQIIYSYPTDQNEAKLRFGSAPEQPNTRGRLVMLCQQGIIFPKVQNKKSPLKRQ